MTSGLDLFARYVARGDSEVHLAEAALLFAATKYPELNLTKYILWLDAQGYRARERFDAQGTQTVVLGGLNELLFDELGFHGNAEHYYDERNSYLNEVIDRRTGIPITLSLLYIEIGRRAGLHVEGIGLPGHFVVRVRGHDWEALVDPFNRGAVLSEEACAQLIAQVYGHPAPLLPHYFQPVGNHALLARMLTNLQAIYLQREDWAEAMRVIEALGSVHGRDGVPADLIRARGLVNYKLSRWAEAEHDWMQYLTLAPDAPDAPVVRQNIQSLRAAIARRN